MTRAGAATRRSPWGRYQDGGAPREACRVQSRFRLRGTSSSNGAPCRSRALSPESRGVRNPYRGARPPLRQKRVRAEARLGTSRGGLRRGALNLRGRWNSAVSGQGKRYLSETAGLCCEEPLPGFRWRWPEQVLHVVVLDRPLDVVLNYSSESVLGFRRRGAGFDEIELEAVSNPLAILSIQEHVQVEIRVCDHCHDCKSTPDRKLAQSSNLGWDGD